MGKALKTAGTIIAGAVLVATGVGALVGVNVAAMGIASFTGSLTIGQLGTLSSGLVALGGMLEKPQSQGSGSPTDWTSNPDQPIPFAFGRVGVSGKIVHRDEYGKDNYRQGIVSVYSGAGPIKGFVSFKADEAAVTFDGAGEAIGKYHGQMWRSTRRGLQPDTALSYPAGAAFPGWTSAHRLSGKACDLWVLQQDSKFSVYPSGEPKPTVVLDGIYGYDPREDDTYPGGSGPCRLDDRSTWPWIEDPIIAALNWALGLRENGQLVGGIGASIDGIDVPAFVEAANISEANGWKISAWPDTSEDASQVLKQMLQAGGAVYARHAGKISCVSRGAPRPSIVTVTRHDTAGPIELDAGATAFNRINTITPRFMSSAHGWKLTPADPVTFEDLRTEDGGKKSDSIDYRFVPAVKQAAELAAYDILDAREPFSGTIPLKPHLRRLKRGDCFVIDEPGFLMDGVKCLVLGRAYDTRTGEVRVSFRSETDGKHPLALGKTTTMPDFPELEVVDETMVPAPDPAEWTLTSEVFVQGGVPVPTLLLVGSVDNAQADNVLFEFRPVGEIDWAGAGAEPPTIQRKEITGLTNLTEYEVSIRYRVGHVTGGRLILGPVTSGSSLPIGGVVGAGIILDPALPLSPGTPPDTAISVAATTATLLGGEVLSFPSATISGLTPDTYYAVFRDLEAGSYVAVSTGLTPYFTSLGRYLPLGFQVTAADSGGTYSPPPPLPPGGGGGIGNCPDESTPILMADGTFKRAGDIAVGDEVWTQHETTEVWGCFPVYAVSAAIEPASLLALADGRELIATPDHRVMVDGRGFVAIKDLRAGEVIAGSEPGMVRGRTFAGERRVIRISVDGAQTYVSAGLLSHNVKQMYAEV